MDAGRTLGFVCVHHRRNGLSSPTGEQALHQHVDGPNDAHALAVVIVQHDIGHVQPARSISTARYWLWDQNHVFQASERCRSSSILALEHRQIGPSVLCCSSFF